MLVVINIACVFQLQKFVLPSISRRLSSAIFKTAALRSREDKEN